MCPTLSAKIMVRVPRKGRESLLRKPTIMVRSLSYLRTVGSHLVMISCASVYGTGRLSSSHRNSLRVTRVCVKKFVTRPSRNILPDDVCLKIGRHARVEKSNIDLRVPVCVCVRVCIPPCQHHVHSFVLRVRQSSRGKVSTCVVEIPKHSFQVSHILRKRKKKTCCFWKLYVEWGKPSSDRATV